MLKRNDETILQDGKERRSRSTLQRLRGVFVAGALLTLAVAPACSGADEPLDDLEALEGDEEGSTAAAEQAIVLADTVTSQVGGADGTFSVDAQGAATYSFPIKVPPGTNGVEPKLALSYRSSGGNGYLGVGWGISGLSAITRCPRTVAQDGVRGGVNGDVNDRFCLDGQRLIAAPGNTYGANGTEYRTEIESYSRIYSYGVCGTGPCRFEVTDKTGNLAVFGQTNSVATYADGTPRSYMMQKLKDRHGNYLTVNYTLWLQQIYPFEIIYTKHDSAPGLKTRRVFFDYQGRDDDEFFYDGGVKVLTDSRMSNIKTYIGTAAGEKLVREYRMTYVKSDLTSRSLLKTINECDALGVCVEQANFEYNRNAAPSNDAFSMKYFTNFTGLENYQNRMRFDPGAYLLPGDMDADGKSDILRVEHSGLNYTGWASNIAGNLSEYFSRGDGTFEPLELTGEAATSRIDGNYIDIFPFDYNGDGRTDFIRREKGAWDDDLEWTFAVYVAKSTRTGFDVYLPGNPTYGWGDFYRGLLGADGGTSVITGDFNGDGRSDFIRSELGTWAGSLPDLVFNVFFSTGSNGTFNPITPTGPDYAWKLRSDYVDIIPGDFNGDGMTDFIRREKSDWDADYYQSFGVYHSRGDGYFDVSFPGVAQAGDIYQDQLRADVYWGLDGPETDRYAAYFNTRIIPGDFNGDGKTDFIRQQYGKSTETWPANNFNVYFSKGKNGEFERVTPAEPAFAPNPPYYSNTMNGNNVDIIPLDYNGDGKTDFIRREKGAWQNDNLNTFHVYISRGDGSFDRIAPGIQGDPNDYYQGGCQAKYAHLIPADVDGDGKTDFIRQEGGIVDNDLNTFQVFLANGDDAADHMKTAKNGLGGTVDVTYAPLSEGSPVYTRGADSTYPNVTFQGPMYVVKSTVIGQGGQTASDTYNYSYTNAVMNHHGRGFLGFAKVLQTGPAGSSEVEYNQNFPYTGTIAKKTIKGASNDYKVETTYTYDTVSAVYGSYAVRPIQEDVTHREGAALNNAYSTRKTFEYDFLGNVAIVHDLGNLSVTQDNVDNCTTWLNDMSSWRIALPAYTRIADSCTLVNGSCNCQNVHKTVDRYYYGSPNVQIVYEFDDLNGAWTTTEFTYDVHGNITSKSLPGQTSRIIDTTTYDSDFKTFPTSQTRSAAPLSFTTSFDHDPRFGTIASQTDANGNTVAYQYDGLGRLAATWEKAPSGALTAVSRIGYGSNTTGKYRQTTHRESWTADSWRSEVEYLDAKGRAWRTESQSTTLGVPVVVLREYDAFDQIKKESSPFYSGSSVYYTTYTRDWLGRVTKVVDVDNKTTNLIYSINTAFCAECTVVEEAVEPVGQSTRTWRKRYNADGRVISQADPELRAASFGYDKLGRKTSITDSGGTTTMVYDSLDRMYMMTSPDRGTVINQYHPGSQWLQKTIQANGDVIEYLYDSLGRVTQKTIVGKQTTSFSYDNPAVTNGVGRLTNVSVTLAGQTTQSAGNVFAYAPNGQITTQQIIIGQAWYSVVSAYDPQKRLTSFTYPDGSVLFRTYNEQGLLANLSMGGTNYATYNSFTAAGQPKTVAYGNTTTGTFAYDNASRLTSAKVTKSDPNNTILMDYTYAWDSVHRITGVTDNRDATRSQAFSYSNSGQLTGATGVYGSLTYAYDNAGNMTKKDVDANTYTYTNHRVTGGNGFSATYDASGNRTGQTRGTTTWSYQYDGEGRLVEVKKGTDVVNKFAYDFAGERVMKEDDNGTITHYVTPNYEVVVLPNGKKVITKYVQGPSGRIAAVTTEVAAGATLLPDIQTLDLLKTLYAKNTLEGRFAYLSNRLQALKLEPWARPIALGTLAFVMAALVARGLRRRFPESAASLAKQIRAALLPEPTAYARRHPVYAMALPIVMAAFLSACGQAPGKIDSGERVDSAELALTPGTNGAGIPEAGTYYFHTNHLSSSSVVTTALGDVKARVEYKPYGEVYEMNGDGTDMFRAKFTGKEWDKDSELYYYNGRYYDPATGRFLTPDTQLVGGLERETTSYNPYAYVHNNPVNYTDPSGHVVLALVIGVAVLVGAFSGGMATNGTWNVTAWNWKGWQTYVGMAIGAAAGAASAGIASMATPAFSFGFLMTATMLESVTLNGLRFISPQGNTMEGWAQGIAIDMATGAVTNKVGPRIIREGKNLWAKLVNGGKNAAAQATKPRCSECMGTLAKGLFKTGTRLGGNEGSRQLGLATTAASSPRLLDMPDSSRADASVVGDYLRVVSDAVLSASGADDIKGRVSADWNVGSNESERGSNPKVAPSSMRGFAAAH